MAEPADTGESYEALMRAYLDLCNRALAKNRDRFPYAAIWQAAEQAMCGREVEFALVDDQPKVRMQVCMKDRQMDWHECDCGHESDVPVKRISADYIRRVLANPDKALEDPSVLDWTWLKGGPGA